MLLKLLCFNASRWYNRVDTNAGRKDDRQKDGGPREDRSRDGGGHREDRQKDGGRRNGLVAYSLLSKDIFGKYHCVNLSISLLLLFMISWPIFFTPYLSLHHF